MKKIFRLPLIVWVILLFLQYLLMLAYQPTSKDFDVMESLEGLYTYGGGTSRSSNYSRIGEKAIFCTVSFWGAEDSCTSKPAGKVVTVDFVELQSLTGKIPLVMSVSQGEDKFLSYSIEQQISRWWSTSVLAATFNAFLLSVICFTGLQVKSIMKNHRGTK